MTPRELYLMYGTTKPEEEFQLVCEMVDNEITPTFISVKELVDGVNKRIAELEAQRDKDLRIQQVRENNLRMKAERERKVEDARKYNLLVRDFEMNGISVRRR